MVDFILFCAIGGAFIGGFYCGKKFNTVGQMIDTATTKVKGWMA